MRRYKVELWELELRNSITTEDKLSQCISLQEEEEKDIARALGFLKMKITPYYLSLIEKDNPHCPIRRISIPTSKELIDKIDENGDPLGINKYNPLPGLTHRYPDRALIYPTFDCASYCRHCFRKKIIGRSEYRLTFDQIKEAVNYISKNNLIRDVILSGGDPLILSDPELDAILNLIRSIRHVQIIRFHTRVVVHLPSRITNSLIATMKRYSPIYVVTQFNHPKEITEESSKACSMLIENGIPVLNQNPLLKGINDNYLVLKELYEKLVYIRVKPYYLVQTILAPGKRHFWVEENVGTGIIKQLRRCTSGLCIPHLITLTNGTKERQIVDTEMYIDNHKRYTFA